MIRKCFLPHKLVSKRHVESLFSYREKMIDIFDVQYRDVEISNEVVKKFLRMVRNTNFLMFVTTFQ